MLNKIVKEDASQVARPQIIGQKLKRLENSISALKGELEMMIDLLGPIMSHEGYPEKVNDPEKAEGSSDVASYLDRQIFEIEQTSKRINIIRSLIEL